MTEGNDRGNSATVAIVTGASQGIGRAVCLELASRGVAVAVTSRRLEACEAVAEEIRADGGEAIAIRCDVADAADVRRMVEQVQREFGRVDILVNNAGIIEPIGPIEECDPDTWQRSVVINLVGAFHTSQAVLPHLRNGGVIVNISSGAAHQPKEGWSAYCAGKAGLAMFTRSLALETSERGILAYGFQPGVVDTEMQTKIRSSGINEVSRLPRERLADPHRPARLIALLCLERPRDLNGEDLSIRDAATMARLEEPRSD